MYFLKQQHEKNGKLHANGHIISQNPFIFKSKPIFRSTPPHAVTIHGKKKGRQNTQVDQSIHQQAFFMCMYMSIYDENNSSTV